MTKRLLLFPLLLFMAGAILLSCVSYCFAADIQPPTDNEVNDWVNKDTLYVSGWSRDKQVKMHSIKNEWDQVKVEYWLYTVYTKTETNPDTDEVSYLAAYSLSIWAGVAGEPTKLENGGLGGTYRAADSTGAAISALDGVIADSSKNLEPGWPVVSPDGKIVSAGSGGSPATGGGSSGSKIPGPSSWSQWLIGTVVAGIIAAIAGFLSSLLGLLPVPVTPTAPPAKAPGKEAVKHHRKPPQSLPVFPPGMMPPPTEIAGGTKDPFDLQKYPNQPAYIGDVISENLNAIKDSAGHTALDTGVAVKDGVFGFVKGLVSIPFTVLQGYVEIGRLTQIVYSDYMSGNTNIFSDLLSSDEGWASFKEVFGTLGKELLPIDEINAFFDNNASLEEKLWAVPSATIKLINLVMMSEKFATASVPGIAEDVTLISSAKAANRAVEAAKAVAAPGVQVEYDAYKAAGNYKAAELTKTVEGGGKLSQEQVLDAMRDPATMRVIKKGPEALQSEFNATQAKEVYQPVYDDVVGYMKGKDPNGVYKVGGVRTPGQSSLINTDNDVILVKLEKTADGSLYWKEVPAKEWEGSYYDSFAKRTNFDPATAKTRFPEKDWDGMTLEEQHKTWTEGHGQEAMDVKNPEAAQSFSNQPTAMDPHWKPGKGSPVSQGEIVDGEGFSMMEKYKTTRGWEGEGATLKSRTEAMEQGSKLCGLSKKMAAQSMERTGQYVRYPQAFTQGEQIINMRNVAPAVRNAALKNLGFKGGYEEFMDKLSSWTGRLP